MGSPPIAYNCGWIAHWDSDPKATKVSDAGIFADFPAKKESDAGKRVD
jgi:hypothetical protein